MRCVTDANVVVAALRSPSGASSALLHMVLDGSVTPLLSVPLVLEYEAVSTAPEQRIISGLTSEEVGVLIDTLCLIGQEVEIHFLWRPHLRDPADEMVLETAVAGNAEAIVTFNKRDFGSVPEGFGIAVLSPKEALERMRR